MRDVNSSRSSSECYLTPSHTVIEEVCCGQDILVFLKHQDVKFGTLSKPFCRDMMALLVRSRDRSGINWKVNDRISLHVVRLSNITEQVIRLMLPKIDGH